MLKLTVTGMCPEIYFFCKGLRDLKYEGLPTKVEMTDPPELVDGDTECSMTIKLVGEK